MQARVVRSKVKRYLATALRQGFFWPMRLKIVKGSLCEQLALAAWIQNPISPRFVLTICRIARWCSADNVGQSGTIDGLGEGDAAQKGTEDGTDGDHPPERTTGRLGKRRNMKSQRAGGQGKNRYPRGRNC